MTTSRTETQQAVLRKNCDYGFSGINCEDGSVKRLTKPSKDEVWLRTSDFKLAKSRFHLF
ncbi:hypothetical protein BpHYR1_021175 [Brachionus plicatilis]|uniref:Uncharacterized protein n=1 Tax=Brachionus plicatilis TaxID=10195 RepID=A0A3M7PW79_BRAPC|nr:hypothetical protein BpHYR1_021175 [Brachionus plicatilis]